MIFLFRVYPKILMTDSDNETEEIQFQDAEGAVDYMDEKNPEAAKVSRKIAERFSSKKKDNVYIVHGQVQSGKSTFIINLAHHFYEDSRNFNVLIVLRNSKSDRQQLKSNFLDYNRGYFSEIPIREVTNRKKVKEQSVFLALNNCNCLRHAQSLLEGKQFVMIIDEADILEGSCENYQIEEINQLKKLSEGHVNITATPLDCFYNEKCLGKNVFTLEPGNNYFGYRHIKKIEYDSNDEWEFIKCMEKLSKNEKVVALISSCRLLDRQKKIRGEILKKYNVCTIIFNGRDGAILKTRELKKGFLTIGDALEHVRKHRYQCTIIVCGRLADRGISFVSRSNNPSYDRKLHLTHQLLLVNQKLQEPSLIQRLRLLGRYQDGKGPTLVAPKNVLEDLEKAICRIEEFLHHSQKKEHQKKFTRKIIKKTPHHRLKLTKRNQFCVKGRNGKQILNIVDRDFSNDGFSLIKYGVDEDIIFQEEVSYRKCLSKVENGKMMNWLDEKTQTGISSFVKKIKIDHYYTKSGILDLLEKCGFKCKERVLEQMISHKDNNYNAIITKDTNGYYFNEDYINIYNYWKRKFQR